MTEPMLQKSGPPEPADGSARKEGTFLGASMFAIEREKKDINDTCQFTLVSVSCSEAVFTQRMWICEGLC